MVVVRSQGGEEAFKENCEWACKETGEVLWPEDVLVTGRERAGREGNDREGARGQEKLDYVSRSDLDNVYLPYLDGLFVLTSWGLTRRERGDWVPKRPPDLFTASNSAHHRSSLFPSEHIPARPPLNPRLAAHLSRSLHLQTTRSDGKPSQRETGYPPPAHREERRTSTFLLSSTKIRCELRRRNATTSFGSSTNPSRSVSSPPPPHLHSDPEPERPHLKPHT